MSDYKELKEAVRWWASSPEDFKVAVWKMFMGASIIGYDSNSRTAVGFTEEKQEESKHENLEKTAYLAGRCIEKQIISNKLKKLSIEYGIQATKLTKKLEDIIEPMTDKKDGI